MAGDSLPPNSPHPGSIPSVLQGRQGARDMSHTKDRIYKQVEFGFLSFCWDSETQIKFGLGLGKRVMQCRPNPNSIIDTHLLRINSFYNF